MITNKKTVNCMNCVTSVNVESQEDIYNYDCLVCKIRVIKCAETECPGWFTLPGDKNTKVECPDCQYTKWLCDCNDIHSIKSDVLSNKCENCGDEYLREH